MMSEFEHKLGLVCIDHFLHFPVKQLKIAAYNCSLCFLSLGMHWLQLQDLQTDLQNFYQTQLQCFCTLQLAFLRLLPCAYNSANTFRTT